MPPRAICPHMCYDPEDFSLWKLPAADLITLSSLDAINTAAYGHIYPEIVQEFWGTAKLTEHDGLLGEFFDYVLNYNMKTISEVLGVRSEGVQYKRGWRVESDDDDIRSTVFQDGKISASEATKATNLTQAAKLIHVLITHVYCPRLNFHDYVYDKDIFIMYHMLKGVRIDPVHLVYDHLISVHANTGHAIPYGYLITRSLNAMMSHPFPGWSHFNPLRTEVMNKDIFLWNGITVPDDDNEDDEDAGMDSEDGDE